MFGKRRALCAAIVIIVFYAAVALASAGVAQGRTGDAPTESEGLWVSPLECSVDLNKIRFDFRLNDYRIGPDVTQPDASTVSVPGLRNMTDRGLPSLPVEGFYVGIPPNASSARVRILHEDFVVESECVVEPLRDAETDSESDIEWSHGRPPDSGLFPEQPVEITHIGSLRSQKIALVRIHPIQYDAVQKLLRVNRSASVEIEFVLGEGAQPFDSEVGLVDEGRFETLLSSLLVNYDEARFYRLRSRGAVGVEAELKAADWYDPGVKYVKLATAEDGLYIVDFGLLKTSGVGPEPIDSMNLKLQFRGQLAPIVLFDGGDSRFDEGDFFVFFGMRKRSEQIGWGLDEYTDESVYWLSWGDGEGLRYESVQQDVEGPLTVLQTDAFFVASEHFEQDLLYDGWNDDRDQDSWFWEIVEQSPGDAAIDLRLNVFAEASGSEATVSVKLKGRTNTIHTPDHHTLIFVNDVKFQDFYWDGPDFLTVPMSIPAGVLHEGRNEIRLESPGDTDASFADSFYVDWAHVDYPRRYKAVKGEAWFGPPPGHGSQPIQYALEGFGANDVLILDLTTGRLFPEYEQVLENGARVLRFVDPAPTPGSVYWAATATALKGPSQAVLDEPSTLKSATNQADLLIISAPEFFEPLGQLVEFRRTQGINVKVVDVQDIFDEFAYGMFSPLAIRSFVWFAYHHWTPPAPTHVLLVGDASWDYRFLLPDSVIPNYVPSYLDPARDDKFVNVTGKESDWYPDLAIGRMPVQNAQELTNMIVSTIRYETAPPPGDWTRRALFVAGGANSTEQEAFIQNCRNLQSRLPGGFEVAEVFNSDEGGDGAGSCTERILEELNRGSLITVFFGHGARDQWGYDNMLNSSHLWWLNCGGKMPMVLCMTCWTAAYANPKTSCIGERFVMEGQAATRSVAYWGSTGLSSIWLPYYLTDCLLEQTLQMGQTDMGLAILAAKLKFYEESDDVTLCSSQTWLGDPMVRMNVAPVPAPYNVKVAMTDGGARVSWEYPTGHPEPAGFDVWLVEWTGPATTPPNPAEDGFSFWVPGGERETVLTGLEQHKAYDVAVRAVTAEAEESLFSEKAQFLAGVIGSGKPVIIAGGYANTLITHEDGGQLDLYALVYDPDEQGDINLVEIYYDGLPTGLYLDEEQPGIYHLGFHLGPGLTPGLYLLSVRAADHFRNASAAFPYFAVRGWGLPWPDGSFSVAGSNWALDPGSGMGPRILAAGYLTDGVTSFNGGEVTLLALVGPGLNGRGASHVGVFFDGIFSGVLLHDDGQHGDFGPGDGIWGLMASFAPGQVPGNTLVGLKAVDENGEAGAMWPFVNVY